MKNQFKKRWILVVCSVAAVLVALLEIAPEYKAAVLFQSPDADMFIVGTELSAEIVRAKEHPKKIEEFEWQAFQQMTFGQERIDAELVSSAGPFKVWTVHARFLKKYGETYFGSSRTYELHPPLNFSNNFIFYRMIEWWPLADHIVIKGQWVVDYKAGWIRSIFRLAHQCFTIGCSVLALGVDTRAFTGTKVTQHGNVILFQASWASA